MILSISLDTFYSKILKVEERIGINLHEAQRNGDLFQYAVKKLRCRFLHFIIPSAFNRRRQSAVCGANSAVIPVAHKISPYHRFQFFYGVVFRFPISAVKQFFLHPCPEAFTAGIIVTSAAGAVHALYKP